MSCIHGLKGLTYEEKLFECHMTNLEERRERGDMIQAYKIIHKKDIEVIISCKGSLSSQCIQLYFLIMVTDNVT